MYSCFVFVFFPIRSLPSFAGLGYEPRSLLSFVRARVFRRAKCSRPGGVLCLYTSVWKSPSDESGVLAEEESQFLLCSSMRSFCSPGTMDSSGVMFLKLSQELWPSGFDLSWAEEAEGKGRGGRGRKTYRRMR